MRVVAERQVDVPADAAAEGRHQRPDDREDLAIEEIEAELRQRYRHQSNVRLAHDELEDGRRFEQLEIDAALLRYSRGEGPGGRSLRFVVFRGRQFGWVERNAIQVRH